MGCTVSVPSGHTSDQDVIKKCKDRRVLIGDAIRHRQKFAVAHLAYLHSIRNIGTLLTRIAGTGEAILTKPVSPRSPRVSSHVLALPPPVSPSKPAGLSTSSVASGSPQSRNDPIIQSPNPPQSSDYNQSSLNDPIVQSSSPPQSTDDNCRYSIIPSPSPPRNTDNNGNSLNGSIIPSPHPSRNTDNNGNSLNGSIIPSPKPPRSTNDDPIMPPPSPPSWIQESPPLSPLKLSYGPSLSLLQYRAMSPTDFTSSPLSSSVDDNLFLDKDSDYFSPSRDELEAYSPSPPSSLLADSSLTSSLHVFNPTVIPLHIHQQENMSLAIRKPNEVANGPDEINEYEGIPDLEAVDHTNPLNAHEQGRTELEVNEVVYVHNEITEDEGIPDLEVVGHSEMELATELSWCVKHEDEEIPDLEVVDHCEMEFAKELSENENHEDERIPDLEDVDHFEPVTEVNGNDTDNIMHDIQLPVDNGNGQLNAGFYDTNTDVDLLNADKNVISGEKVRRHNTHPDEYKYFSEAYQNGSFSEVTVEPSNTQNENIMIAEDSKNKNVPEETVVESSNAHDENISISNDMQNDLPDEITNFSNSHDDSGSRLSKDGAEPVVININDYRKERPKRGLHVPHIEYEGDLTELLDQIEEEFKKAYNSGQYVSSVLESSQFSDMEDSTKTFRQYKYRKENTSEDRRVASHASTLDRLYAWEKKLHHELKEGELIRIIFDQRYRQLYDLNVKDVHPRVTDKAKANLKDLDAQLLVAYRAMQVTSMKIQDLTNEELYTQLLDLLSRLRSMWQKMAEYHRMQQMIALELKAFENLIVGEELSEARIRAMMELEHEVKKWPRNLKHWIRSHNSYIKDLNTWSELCYEANKQSNDGKKRSSGFKGRAPFYSLLKEWTEYIPELESYQKVLGSIQRFCNALHMLERIQSHDLKLKMQSERSSKMDYPSFSFRKLEKVYAENINSFAESLRRDRSGSTRRRVDGMSGLDSVPISTTLDLLKHHLPKVFEDMASFAEDAWIMYEKVQEKAEHGCAPCGDIVPYIPSGISGK